MDTIGFIDAPLVALGPKLSLRNDEAGVLGHLIDIVSSISNR